MRRPSAWRWSVNIRGSERRASYEKNLLDLLIQPGPGRFFASKGTDCARTDQVMGRRGSPVEGTSSPGAVASGIAKELGDTSGDNPYYEP